MRRRQWQFDIDQWLAATCYVLTAVVLVLFLWYEIKVGWTRLPW